MINKKKKNVIKNEKLKSKMDKKENNKSSTKHSTCFYSNFYFYETTNQTYDRGGCYDHDD